MRIHCHQNILMISEGHSKIKQDQRNLKQVYSFLPSPLKERQNLLNFPVIEVIFFYVPCFHSYKQHWYKQVQSACEKTKNENLDRRMKNDQS